MKRLVAIVCCAAMLLCGLSVCAEAEKPAPHADFEQLYQINNHMVGWLEATEQVAAPVVQYDNEFYLDHSFFGEEDDGGTLFVNKANTIWPADKHLLIHGNNVDFAGFDMLYESYSEVDALKNDPIVSLQLLDAETPTAYVPVAVLEASTNKDSDKYFNIGQIAFDSDDEFIAFAQALQDKSMYTLPVDVQAGDYLISMMTYVKSGDEYVLFVVTCRELRAGETEEGIVELMQTAAKK